MGPAMPLTTLQDTHLTDEETEVDLHPGLWEAHLLQNHRGTQDISLGLVSGTRTETPPT